MFYLEEVQGICSSCANQQNCGYRLANVNLGTVIWECNEIDSREDGPVLSKSLTTQPSVPNLTPKSANTGRQTGLCVNCDNQKTCALPVVEGGVWHCEQYL